MENTDEGRIDAADEGAGALSELLSVASHGPGDEVPVATSIACRSGAAMTTRSVVTLGTSNGSLELPEATRTNGVRLLMISVPDLGWSTYA